MRTTEHVNPAHASQCTCKGCTDLRRANYERATGDVDTPIDLRVKLATLVWYLTDKIHHPDPQGFQHWLNDPQLAAWVDRMDKAGLINRTAFINNSPFSTRG